MREIRKFCIPHRILKVKKSWKISWVGDLDLFVEVRNTSCSEKLPKSIF
jgi:hypothetical protein